MILERAWAPGPTCSYANGCHAFQFMEHQEKDKINLLIQDEIVNSAHRVKTLDCRLIRLYVTNGVLKLIFNYFITLLKQFEML